MPIPTPIRNLLLFGVLACLGTVVHAGITVTQNLGAGANSWPGTALISTTSQPNIQSTVGESFSGTTTSLGQTFTLPAGNNYKLQSVYLYVGGGTGTGGSAPVTVSLYDLGAIAAPNPSPYSTNNNLLGSGNGVAITYTAQTAGLLKLDFTGTDQVVLGAGHMYAFEIYGTSGTNPMPWYRSTAEYYSSGAAYRDRTWINGNNAREFSMAVYGVITLDQPGPVSCTVNAADVRQQVDGFGAGVAFLNNGVVQLSESQADQLYGTSGTQAGLTLLRVRISPTGDNTYALQDGQKAYARGARILASPWTPPAAMKSNGNTVGGSLLPTYYAAYATYLNDFATFMANNNAPLSVISLQNEPDWDPTYEGCTWTADQFHTFCRDFAGAINVPVMMPESLNFNQTYSDATLNDPVAAANVDYVGGHLYGATIKDYPLARSLGKRLWMTEYLENDQTIESAVVTARQIIDCFTVGNMSAYIWWKCIGNANGLLNDTGVPQRRSYVMGQFSRYVRPGDSRVAVSANSGPMGIAAFKNAAGDRLHIVVANNTTLAIDQTFNLQGITLTAMTPAITSATQSLETLTPVAVSNAAFTYSIPANSVVTFSGVVAPAVVAPSDAIITITVE